MQGHLRSSDSSTVLSQTCFIRNYGSWPRPAIGLPLGIPVGSWYVYWVQTSYFPKQLAPSIVTWLQASRMRNLFVFYDECSKDGWWRYAMPKGVGENTRRNLSLISSYAPTLVLQCLWSLRIWYLSLDLMDHCYTAFFSWYVQLLWMEFFCFYLLENVKTLGWHFHA